MLPVVPALCIGELERWTTRKVPEIIRWVKNPLNPVGAITYPESIE